MLESEALTKWCPMTRVINKQGDGAGNRWDSSGDGGLGPIGCLCAGSACMMWQPSTPENDLPAGDCGLKGRLS